MTLVATETYVGQLF